MSPDKARQEGLCQAEEFRLYLGDNRDPVTDFKHDDYILRMISSNGPPSVVWKKD